MKSNSKFKVGDKVRVINGDFYYPTGYMGTITYIKEDGYICQIGDGETLIKCTDIELITPLTFDFDKAIAGEPIYCNEERVHVSFMPTPKVFISQKYDYVAGRWDKSGYPFPDSKSQSFLTTIPPVEYVEESRWVWVNADSRGTSPAYYDKDIANENKPKYYDNWQLCQVKIKVRK